MKLTAIKIFEGVLYVEWEVEKIPNCFRWKVADVATALGKEHPTGTEMIAWGLEQFKAKPGAEV